MNSIEKPLIDQYDEDKLSPSWQSLLTPDSPIPDRVLFIPRRRTWTSVVLTIVASSTAVLAGTLIFVIALALGSAVDANVSYGSQSFSGLAAAGAAFVIGGLLWMWSVRTKVRGLRAQQAGRPLRYGLFLTPEGLLERRDVGYTMVPRSRIRELKFDEGGAALIVFVCDDVGERTLSLSKELGDGNPQAIMAVIYQWLAASNQPAVGTTR